MAKVRFNIFNAEEFDTGAELSGDAEVTVSDAVESETQAIETEEEIAEVAEDIATTEEAEETADELQEQIEENEKAIENNEVTEDTVAVAQERFYDSISNIRCLKEYSAIKSRYSAESYASPVEKLRLSTEGVKEFVVELIERIKLAFLKIKELIKKLYVKFVVMMTNVEKKAKALIKELDNLKDAKSEVELSGEQVEKVTNLFKCFLAAGVIKSTKDLGKVVDTVNNVKTDLTNFANDLISATLETESRVDVMTKLAVTKNANAIYAPYFVKGTLKALIFEKSEEKVKPVYEEISVDNNGDIDKKACSITELKNILGKVSKAQSDINKLIESGKKVQETLYKHLDALEKVNGEIFKFGSDRMRANNELRLFRRVGTNIILDITLNYVYNIKNVLSVAAMITKEYGNKK